MKRLSGTGWANQAENGYEVSSKGDRRFSALYARLPDGRIIEDAWGQAKGYSDGRTAKGRPALTPDFDYWGTYKGLWQQWADANPQLMDELAAASQGQVLVDRFAKTDNNQARALAEILAERPAPMPGQPAAAVAMPFEIVASRGPDVSYDVLGMRQGGATMATVSVPFEPGWLGNPYVANDAGGTMSREQATAAFGALVREKAQDAAWREAFLSLKGKRVGYYKPKEPAIHLHELQRWINEQDGGVPPVPEQPAAAMKPTGQQAPDAVQLRVQDDPQRKAGDLLPWLLAAGGGGLAAYALAEQLNRGNPGAPQALPPGM